MRPSAESLNPDDSYNDVKPDQGPVWEEVTKCGKQEVPPTYL